MVKSSLLTLGTTAAFNYLRQEILLLGQRKGFNLSICHKMGDPGEVTERFRVFMG